MKGLGFYALLALGLLGAARPGGSQGGSWGPLPPPPGRTDVPVTPGWLSFDDIVRVALEAGFTPERAHAAARIAWRESKGNPRARAIVTAPLPGNLPERSFGLWQVNTLANPGYDEGLLLDPAYNAQAAYTLSRGGSNWSPWRVR